jgi:hypothetical protein
MGNNGFRGTAGRRGGQVFWQQGGRIRDACQNGGTSQSNTAKAMKPKPITRARLARIYDKLYAQAERLLASANPCGIHKQGGHVICNGCNKGRSSTLPDTLCCGGCNYAAGERKPSAYGGHHDKKRGCTAEKPLACKTWLCDRVRFPNDGYGPITPLAQKLRHIRNKAIRLNLHVIYGDRRQSLDSAMEAWRKTRQWQAQQAKRYCEPIHAAFNEQAPKGTLCRL